MDQNKSSVDILFKEHSFEEIETVRDNLASEIDKRTELLKSIVKEKYRDVLETSDAIQSMKLNLNRVENSIQKFDERISTFYRRLREPQVKKQTVTSIYQSNNQAPPSSKNDDLQGDDDLKKLLSITSEIWDHFDASNLKATIRTYNSAKRLLDKCKKQTKDEKTSLVINDIESNLNRSTEIIKNHLWHRIQSAESNQIGVITDDGDLTDEGDLYTLSLQSSMEHLVRTLRRDMLDTSNQTQIKRYQQYSYFNTESNIIDEQVSDMKPPATGYLQIPKEISIELSNYLFNICRVINTIAGFSLTRSSIIESLRLTMSQIVDIYEDTLTSIETLSAGSKRRRALQLYFDLMYIRVLLNTSKDLELIEDLDPKVSNLMSKYEVMLDTIELYVVSEAMHTNVLNLTKSTVRLYGLLVPYLQ